MLAELKQGSAEWLAARCGSLGASAVHESIARTKTGWGASRANIRVRLVAERLTGQPQDTFQNAAMAWGNEQEANARAAYAFLQSALVQEVGIYKHPSIDWTHASPDGLAECNGLIEIKCPNTATHIETLKSQSIAGKYITQMNWQMACTGRDWCDFVSFDPRMPDDLQFWCKRIDRDDKAIAELEEQVAEFLAEVQADIDALNNLRAAA